MFNIKDRFVSAALCLQVYLSMCLKDKFLIINRIFTNFLKERSQHIFMQYFELSIYITLYSLLKTIILLLC